MEEDIYLAQAIQDKNKAEEALAFRPKKTNRSSDKLTDSDGLTLCRIIQTPTETRQGKITEIFRLSDSISKLYYEKFFRGDYSYIGLIRTLVKFPVYPPAYLKNGSPDYDHIHDKAIAVLPSFKEILPFKEIISEKTLARGLPKTRKWKFQLLLSGSKSLGSLSRYPKIDKFLKYARRAKIGFSIAWGRLIGDFGEAGELTYNGIFLGLGPSFSLSTPGGDMFSKPFPFISSQEISIDEFDKAFTRLTVISASVGDSGYSISFFSFHKESIGDQGVSMYVGGPIVQTGVEAGIYGGVWINLD